MSKKKFSDFPVPPLLGRQWVRDLLNDFFTEWFYTENPRETAEKYVNKLVDLIEEELKSKKEE